MPKLTSGSFSVSGETIQLAVGVTSPTTGLYSMPRLRRGVTVAAALNLHLGRLTDVSTQRRLNCHLFSRFPEPRNRPSPGHPAQVGTATGLVVGGSSWAIVGAVRVTKAMATGHIRDMDAV